MRRYGLPDEVLIRERCCVNDGIGVALPSVDDSAKFELRTRFRYCQQWCCVFAMGWLPPSCLNVFSRSSGNSAAEHRGGLDEYGTSGLTSGMVWFTARRGGSLGGGGPYNGANLSIHFWRRGSTWALSSSKVGVAPFGFIDLLRT